MEKDLSLSSDCLLAVGIIFYFLASETEKTRCYLGQEMAGERKQSRHHDEPLLLPCGGKRRGPAAQVAALHLFLWSDSNQGGPLPQRRSLQYISASIGKLFSE